MKRIQLITLIFACIILNTGKAQVTLHPEIGLSYLPFKTSYINGYNKEVRNIDFLFGISAELPINKKWSMKTRFSFTDRKDFERNYSIFVDVNEQYIHSDLNIDLSVKYKLNNLIDIGGGPSIIKSFEQLNTTYYWYDDRNTYSSENLGKIYFALNCGVSMTLQRFKINFSYIRIFRYDDYIRYYSMEKGFSGSNRFDLTISYHLLGGNKGKKR